MQHLVKRTGSRIRQRLGIILAVAALVVAVVFLVRPNKLFGRPDLQLVALDASGLFSDSVDLPRAWADTSFKGAYGATARIPLVLGVRNIGEVAGGARALEMSLPARYRLEAADGRELPNQSDPGNPLIRYTIRGPFPPVRPGALPTVLPAVDTVWLEPVVPQLYCIAVGDSVPEFIPAAEPDPRLLSSIKIFYSFDVRGHARQAGLLNVQLDPSVVERPPSSPPPVFPTAIREPAWPLPPMGDLRRVGTNVARCGPPESPMSLASTIWQGAEGGRLLVLAYGGKARKYLFDLNRDSIVDLEMWDASGTGRFDAQREARYPIPPFLLPPPGAPPFNPAVFADLSPDSMAALRQFRTAGTYVPRTRPDATHEGVFADAGRYSPRAAQRATAYEGFVAGEAQPTGTAPSAAGATTPGRRGPRLLGRPVRIPAPANQR